MGEGTILQRGTSSFIQLKFSLLRVSAKSLNHFEVHECFNIILLPYRSAKTARSKTKMMLKLVHLVRMVEKVKRRNEPGSKQKIQRTREKRTTQHLEKAQTIDRLMHRKRETTTPRKEKVVVFTQQKGQQETKNLITTKKLLHHLLAKPLMTLTELSRLNIPGIPYPKHL